MPTSDGRTYGLKFVNGHPGNTHHGLQTVTAFGVLADVATRLSDASILGNDRGTGTVARRRPGHGRQAYSPAQFVRHGADRAWRAVGIPAHAFRAICGIKTIRTWDIDPEAMRKFNRNMAASGLTIINAASAEEAVQGADMVTRR